MTARAATIAWALRPCICLFTRAQMAELGERSRVNLVECVSSGARWFCRVGFALGFRAVFWRLELVCVEGGSDLLEFVVGEFAVVGAVAAVVGFGEEGEGGA